MARGDVSWTDPVSEDGRNLESVESWRCQRWRRTAARSDLRLTGTMTMAWDWDDFDEATDTSVTWGTITIENEQGSWSGSFTGVEYPSGLVDSHAWPRGSGACEGPTVFLYLQCPTRGPALERLAMTDRIPGV